MHNLQFFWLSFLVFTSFCIAPLNYVAAAKADVGVILDLDTTVRKMCEMANEDIYSKRKDDVRAMVGHDAPPIGKKLRVGVPVKSGFGGFIKDGRDPETNVFKPTGFCIEVFEEVMKSMPYEVEYVPSHAGNYDDLVKQISNQSFDAVAGDVTITAKRSEFVDFTVPYLRSGVAIIVPVKHNDRKSAWIFMKPLTPGHWLTIGASFVFTGVVVWVLKHGANKDFRGPPHQQVGTIFWFSFSTLVFAHREKVTNNLTKFVLIVWMFVVLVLTSSYTANLTTMLTVKQLQPTITDIRDLIRTGECVGYQQGSFVPELLNKMKFNSSKFKNYSSVEDYNDALAKGCQNGGVAAIVDELPYLRFLIQKYRHKYTLIGPWHPTSGLAFACPKGSPLVPNVSRAILELREGQKLVEISRKWFGEQKSYSGSQEPMVTSESLGVDSFKGLFLIAGLSSASALAIFLSKFLYENRYILASDDSIKQKLHGLSRAFDQDKDDISSSSKESRNPGEIISAISISCDHQQGMFSKDEGLSTIELGTIPEAG